MLKLLVVAGALAAVLAAAPASASILPQIDEALELSAERPGLEPVLMKHYVEIAPGVYQAVKGARERRQIRMARWIEGLEGDRARIFADLGMPTFRWFELSLGERREFWSYEEAGRTFIFRGDRMESSRPR